jgi:hypothetical protein
MAQHQHRCRSPRETAERVSDLLARHPFKDDLLRTDRTQRDAEACVAAVTAATPTDGIQAGVHRSYPDPGRCVSRPTGIRETVLGCDEDLLGHVLSRVYVTNNAVGEANDVWELSAEERLEVRYRTGLDDSLRIDQGTEFHPHQLLSTTGEQNVTSLLGALPWAIWAEL